MKTPDKNDKNKSEFLTKEFFDLTNDTMKRIEQIRSSTPVPLSQRIARFLAG